MVKGKQSAHKYQQTFEIQLKNNKQTAENVNKWKQTFETQLKNDKQTAEKSFLAPKFKFNS